MQVYKLLIFNDLSNVKSKFLILILILMDGSRPYPVAFYQYLLWDVF